MRLIVFIFCFLSTSIALAQMEPFDYRLGKILVNESVSKIVIQAERPVTVDVSMGGYNWPLFSLDETGRIYAGNVVIDSDTGSILVHPTATLALWKGLEINEVRNGYTFRHAGKSCYLSFGQLGLSMQEPQSAMHSNYAIKFSNSANKLMALVRRFDEYGHTSNYLIEEIDLYRCQIVFRKNLGDPDYLIELNYSTEGGWWIAGSIEQTLLQSMDGRHWHTVTLPEGLSQLISAYIANPLEIWLAAILLSFEDSPYLLVYSNDGGVTWRNVVANDLILQRLPIGWLEGQKRRVLR